MFQMSTLDHAERHIASLSVKYVSRTRQVKSGLDVSLRFKEPLMFQALIHRRGGIVTRPSVSAP